MDRNVIICRCMEITCGDVLDAIDEGACTVAGVSAAEAIGRMDAAETESLRTAARERIAVLESGSFGESRKAARHMQIADMCAKEGN